MVKQSSVFYHAEGSAWLERNKDKLIGDNDPVMEALKLANIKPNLL